MPQNVPVNNADIFMLTNNSLKSATTHFDAQYGGCNKRISMSYENHFLPFLYGIAL